MTAIDKSCCTATNCAEAFDKGDLASPGQAHGGGGVHRRADRRAPHPRATKSNAHVIRNAGGLVADDVIHSLTISQRKLGRGRSCS